MRFHFALLIVLLAVFQFSCQRSKTEAFLPVNSSLVVGLDLKNTGSNLIDFSSLLGNNKDSLWAIASKAMDSGVDINGRVCMAVFPDTATGLNTQVVFVPISDKAQFKQFLISEFKGQSSQDQSFSKFVSEKFTCLFTDQMAFIGIDVGRGQTSDYMLTKIASGRPRTDLPFAGLFSKSFELATWSDLTKLPVVSDLAQLSGKMELSTYTSFKKGAIETIGLLQADESTGPILTSLFQDPMNKAQVEDATSSGTLAQIHFQINVDNLWSQLEKMGKLNEFRINAALMGFNAEQMKNMVNGSYSFSLVESDSNGFTPLGSLKIRIGLKEDAGFEAMMKGFVSNGSMRKVEDGYYESRWFPNTEIRKKKSDVFITLGDVKMREQTGTTQTSVSQAFPNNWKFEPINFQANLSRMPEGMNMGASLSNLFISARPEKNGELKLKLVVNTNRPDENALKTLLETNQSNLIFFRNQGINL